jgi:hypothetical protein
MAQYFGTARIGKAQSVAYTGSVGTIPAGISGGVNRIRVLVTSDAMVTTDGSTPAVSPANGAYIPALAAEYLTVNAGEQPKAIQVSAGGTLFITECS